MTISQLTFNNRFIHHLPADSETGNFPRQVSQAAYSFVTPTPVKQPQLIAIAEDVAAMVGFTLTDTQTQDFAQIFAGNTLMQGMQSYAMCYGGHQFGQWAGQLGDGRAINLGEVVTPKHGHKTLQLKGAGLTPYSRTADGLAVLRSSVREFLCSEAMYHLGIPTTRALSLCLTGEQVVRDMFYNGNAKPEPGAVVCRVSSSFMRFGSFQLPSSRKDLPLLTLLVKQCIQADYPHLLPDETVPEEQTFNKDVYLAWFNEVTQRTCKMIIHWMRVGFVHGVMNTDNMSILGETIDYGPYGWIDDFDLQWTPNTTDAQGRRYRFGAQAEMGQWNLYQLANSLYPLIEDAEPLEAILNNYAEQYREQWHEMMSHKLGLAINKSSTGNITAEKEESDIKFFIELETILSMVETDMTLFYRQLAKLPMDNQENAKAQWFELLSCCYYQIEQIDDEYKVRFEHWLLAYDEKLKQNQINEQQRQQLMNATNPKYVLRNYIAQQAIDLAEQGDFSEIEKLQQLLKKPYDEQMEYDKYAQKRPDWARNKAGCSMLSCSS